MDAGTLVSVKSQADTEQADLNRERGHLAMDRETEHAELAAIYVARGLDAGLAGQEANQLMAKDALGAPRPGWSWSLIMAVCTRKSAE